MGVSLFAEYQDFVGSNTITKIFQYNLSNGPLLSPSQGVNFSSTIRIYQPPHFNGGSSKLLNECGMFFVILTDHYYVFLGVCSTGFLIREKFGFPEMLVSPCSSDSSYVLHSQKRVLLTHYHSCLYQQSVLYQRLVNLVRF